MAPGTVLARKHLWFKRFNWFNSQRGPLWIKTSQSIKSVRVPRPDLIDLIVLIVLIVLFTTAPGTVLAQKKHYWFNWFNRFNSQRGPLWNKTIKSIKSATSRFNWFNWFNCFICFNCFNCFNSQWPRGPFWRKKNTFDLNGLIDLIHNGARCELKQLNQLNQCVCHVPI